MSKVQTRTVSSTETGVRLNRWFKRHFPQVGLSQLQKLLRTGQIRVDGKRVQASARLEEGQTVRIPPLPDKPLFDKERGKASASPKESADLRARILYQDADVLVIDKPAGLAVQGGTGIFKSLDAMLDALKFDAEERPRLVHRLDRDTSGVLLLARHAKAASVLGRAFRFGDIRKYYWAVTVGVPKPIQGKITLALSKQGGPGFERMAPDEDDGKEAVTLYQVIEPAGQQAAWVALWPLTGRTHQLRAHMAAIETPILGDGKYGDKKAFLEDAEIPRVLHLHARRIIFAHPVNGRVIDIKAPLPSHMKKTWTHLGFSHDDGDPFAAVE